MMILEQHFLGNTPSQWLTAAVATAAIFVILVSIKLILYKLLSALGAKTHNEVDDLIADLLKRLKIPTLVVIALYAGARFLKLGLKVKSAFNILLVITLLLQLAMWGNGLINYYINRRRLKKFGEDASSTTTLTALSYILKVALWSLLLLLGLENLGINITALVTGLGIGGVAIALSLQHVLTDLFAALSIVMDKPFIIGDFITVDSFMGNVEHIGLKTTRLRSISGEQLIFSNSDLLSSRIRNLKRMEQRRILFNIGVVYQTPPEKLEIIPTLIEEIIRKVELARFERAHFKTFDASSLGFEIVYWVESPEYIIYMDIQQNINLQIYQKFAELGIEFAYPTQTLHIAKES
jgi:small-conductance mechanosensitive channel